ncbi:MAG TPA: hypothetical protein VIK18_20530 [Pirellulales bacterium]
MNVWYPEIPLRRLPALVAITAMGALFAGLYGAIHDQISYSISQEYFTKLKFYQFAYANFGWPPRLFAAEVGFLATWWVGLIGGWLLARIGLATLWTGGKPACILRAFALAAAIAVTVGALGVLVAAIRIKLQGVDPWEEWQTALRLRDPQDFVIVAYLHAASYLGGLLRLLCAAVYVRKKRCDLVGGLPNS